MNLTLDGHPHDNVVSRHELFPVKAPLQVLEHCIGDFLDQCDENNDHGISFKVKYFLYETNLKSLTHLYFDLTWIL